MGSSEGFIEFEAGECYSTLTGLLVVKPLDTRCVPKTSGEITEWFIYMNNKHLADKKGIIVYTFNGVNQQTTVSFGCTLEWKIADNTDCFHPRIYSDLYAFVKTDPFFIK